MKFKFKFASDLATVREEKTAYEKEFETLEDFIKYCFEIKQPVIVNYQRDKNKITEELIIYDYYLE